MNEAIYVHGWKCDWISFSRPITSVGLKRLKTWPNFYQKSSNCFFHYMANFIYIKSLIKSSKWVMSLLCHLCFYYIVAFVWQISLTCTIFINVSNTSLILIMDGSIYNPYPTHKRLFEKFPSVLWSTPLIFVSECCFLKEKKSIIYLPYLRLPYFWECHNVFSSSSHLLSKEKIKLGILKEN
jgi:hypothetical protein